jgi:hypothetical protein
MFHVFAFEYEGNMGDTSEERERIAIAADASLDEGAIIRATHCGASPLAGDTAYFLGLDMAEAECVRRALLALRDSAPESFDNYWGPSVLGRVERLLGYEKGE